MGWYEALTRSEPLALPVYRELRPLADPSPGGMRIPVAPSARPLACVVAMTSLSCATPHSPTRSRPPQAAAGAEDPASPPVSSSLDPAAEGTAAASGMSRDDLAREATDPTAPLLALNFVADVTTSFYGPSNGLADDDTELRFQPVVPFRAWGTNNILRAAIPYNVDGRSEEGLGTVTLFDLTVFGASWGRWGVGPVMAFSPADTPGDSFAIGPALGGVMQFSKKFQAGLFNQNLFAGDTAISQLQPIAAYQLGDGWTLSLGDLQFVYDWERSRWLSVPIGFQIGRVMPIAKQPMRFSIKPQYQAINDSGLPQWTFLFTATILAPTGAG